MSTPEDFTPYRSPIERLQDTWYRYNMLYRRWVDRCTPHLGARWASFGVLALLFALRILLRQGFYVVAYAWAIYLLNIFLLFLSPRFAPELEEAEEAEDDGNGADTILPTGNSPAADGEFRPFIRRLPEFRFWYNATWATLLAFGCTAFDAFDIPVFWPILLMYFIFLFVLTMRRQIGHMIKYKYVPFDVGKKSYSGIGRK